MFKLFDQIETEKFVLRPLTQDDRLSLYSIASDPSIWSQHPEPNRYQRPVFDRYFDKIISLEAPIIILDKHEGTPVGSSSYYFYNFEKSIITIGYSFLAVKYWGGQANREIKRELINYALQFVKVVEFEAASSNLRSRAALEKIGALLDRTTIKSTPSGPPHEGCIYRITSPLT
jgi:RimJ/RimL family protein N-acetyltransferase